MSASVSTGAVSDFVEDLEKGEKKKKVQAGFCDMQTFVPFEF